MGAVPVATDLGMKNKPDIFNGGENFIEDSAHSHT